MQRVLIFSLTYEPFVGGAEIAIREITDRLDSAHFSFDLITLRIDRRLPRTEKVGNVTVHRVGMARRDAQLKDTYSAKWAIGKALFVPRSVLKALSLHKKKKYDILWGVMSNMGFPIVLFRFFHKVPYILTIQDGDNVEHIAGRGRVRLVYPLFKKIFRDARVVQSISTFLDRFAKNMGTRGTRVVVPNGVDVRQFHQAFGDAETARIREKHGLKASTRYLITTSRLVYKNAVDAVIRSLVFLPEHIEFLIVGGGPLETKLRALAEKEGVARRTHFLGHVAHEEVPLYLSVADIFVRPSRSEGMGISFLEAMAAGLPVVATPVGGITDFLKDEETGLFCRVDDPQSLANRVAALLGDTLLRRKLIDNARIMVEEKYTWEHVVDRMKNEVFSVLPCAS